MRPILLELSGIGPFVRPQSLDFGNFGDNALFLIHGPTGGGKTFLFDAICYALYADTPAGREGHLKSDFLSDDVEPYIDLRFGLGSREYRIRRQLAYRRPKKRGEGFTTTEETQVLYDSQGTVLAEKKTEVNQLIKEILGLEAGQFRQVVMIPQGDFRRLLLSGSDDREELMERLFDTGPYKAVQERLREMEERAERTIDTRKAELDRLERELADLRDPEESNEPLPYASAISIMDERLRTLAEEAAEASRNLDDATAVLERAKALSLDHDRFSSLTEEQARLEQQRETMDSLRDKLEIAGKAAGLEDRYGNLRSSRLAAMKAKQALDEVQSRIEGLRVRRIDLDARAAQGPGMTERRESLNRLIVALEPFRDEHVRLISLDRRIREIRGKFDEAESQRHKFDEERTRGTERLGEIDRLLEDLAGDGGADERLDIIGKLESLILIRKKLEAREEERVLAGNHLVDAEGKSAAASKALSELEERRRADLSGELASALEDGSPCPVCGSLHHPNPASEGEGPSAEAWEHVRSEAVLAAEGLARARAAVDTGEALVEESRSNMVRIAAEVGESAEQPEESIRALQDARDRERDLRNERETLLRDTLPGLSKKLEELSAETEGFRRELNGLTNDREERKAAWDKALSVFSDHSEAPEPADLPGRLEEWSAEVQRLSEDLEALNADSLRLNELIKQTESEAKVREEYRIVADDDLIGQQEAFLKSLAELGFEDEETYRHALELSSSSDTDRAKLESWTNRRNEVSTLLTETERRIDGRLKPDLVTAERDRNILSKKAAEIAGRLARGTEVLRRLKETLRRFEALEEETAESELRHSVLRRLSRQVRGTDPPKISLNRFFLARRLEEVLIQATRRLSLLSRGRFTLKRRDEGKTAGSQAGLDLMVSDGWTGTDRPVNTLSGGQLFMASLALALGLADVVQARSGGVKLEALFLDEGFGTLDDESLQGVLGVLNDLREDRMVGVISHVPELRRQISNRIEVGRDSVGSTTRLIVGN